MEDYYAAVEEARLLEKKALKYQPYRGDINIEKAVEMSSGELADMTYGDLLNLYERTEKITAARKSIYGMVGAEMPAGPAVVTKVAEGRSREVAEQMQRITTETLEKAEEISKEFEKEPVEAKQQTVPQQEQLAVKEGEFEFELETGQQAVQKDEPGEFDFEEEKSVGAKPEEPIREESLEFEGMELPPPEKAEQPEEETSGAETQKQSEEAAPAVKAPEVKVPPVLETEEKAAKKLESMEEKIRETLGGKTDETGLKKRMLQLTKELFKEKSVNKREQIKMEITVLKNMLSGAMEAPKATTTRGAPAKTSIEKAAKGQLLETLLNTQTTGLSNIKELILSKYAMQAKSKKRQFLTQLQSIPKEQADKRKQAYEKFVFELTVLSEKLPAVVNSYRDATLQKHKAEMVKLMDSIEADDKELRKKISSRLASIDGDYTSQFDNIREIAAKNMSTAMELAGAAVFAGEEETGEEKNTNELIAEINDTDEGTLLYYLHSKEPEYYKGYERKHIAKGEALSKAKMLMAREKGLSRESILKYFGTGG